MRRGFSGLLGVALLTGALAVAQSAAADDQPTSSQAANDQTADALAARPKFQLPFKCGTRWQLNTYDSGHNPAIDMVVKGNTGSRGQTVRASYGGTVASAYYDNGAGNVIQINHGGGWFTAYYHLLDSPTTYVKVGQRVNMYTQIGRVGRSGANGGGWDHLHYEQRLTDPGADHSHESDRVAAYFNTRQFTGVGRQWSDVVGHNCTWEKPTTFCTWKVKDTPWGSVAMRSFSGTKYDQEGRISDGTIVSAGLNGARGDWRRLNKSGGSDNRGPWVSSTWLQYLGGTGCPV